MPNATRHSENYRDGRIAESDTWEYLRKSGFVRPTKEQRLNIGAAFLQRGVSIHTSAFDVVCATALPAINSPPTLSLSLETLILFEVKTSGTASKTEVTPGFRGLGFTLTTKEHHNATVLGAQYRFLFVNLRTLHHRECLITDFFHSERARIYQTWSVFLNRDLPAAMPETE